MSVCVWGGGGGGAAWFRLREVPACNEFPLATSSRLQRVPACNSPGAASCRTSCWSRTSPTSPNGRIGVDDVDCFGRTPHVARRPRELRLEPHTGRVPVPATPAACIGEPGDALAELGLAGAPASIDARRSGEHCR
eukprot:358738-Chlamydomonas_euryale.AAC.4